jgi:hypothetical protein
MRILASVKRLARQYYEATGKPLGATAEIAEYEAARLLNLELAPPRQQGYDAVRRSGAPRLVQIKGRCILDKNNRSGRVGKIRLDCDWDSVVLVLLDGRFEPLAMYEAERAVIVGALRKPGSRARNERGQLGIAQFKAMAKQVWPPIDAMGS